MSQSSIIVPVYCEIVDSIVAAVLKSSVIQHFDWKRCELFVCLAFGF